MPADQSEVELFAMSAVFTVADVGAAVGFYRDVLGFAVQYMAGDPPGYAIVCRGGASLHLQPAGRNAAAEAALGRGTIYVWVSDAAALRDQLAAAGCPIDVALCDTPYGTRELGVRDPDGNRLSFAQNLSSDAD